MSSNKEISLRSFHIDVIKFIAILGIFFWHYYKDYYAISFSIFGPEKIQNIIEDANGIKELYLAVQYLLLGIGAGMPALFIICSGYGLFGSHLIKEKGLKDFYISRFVRVVPLYWIALGFHFLIYPFLHSIYAENFGNSIRALINHIFLVQGYTDFRLYFGALWFIGYIVQFYILFPVLVKLYSYMNRWAILALSFALTMFMDQVLSYTDFQYAMNLPTRFLPLFIFGMTLAAEAHYGNLKVESALKGALISAASIAMLVLILLFVDRGVLSFSSALRNVFYILIFTAILPLSQIAYRSTYITWAVLSASCSSYILFLVHQPVYRYFFSQTTLPRMIPDYLQPVFVLTLFCLIGVPAYFLQRRYNSLARNALLKMR